ncbi:hypothetical protein EIN_284680 [Entamoeba invadens IP1]|uniref:HD domain-containing protein n=1 Tax=Entamoeba invadens IP1 TaxID=370355 RepID=L7FKF2_ENTIV|nr:hypothetical protein EIN_284680 [Entamoeba invadens IP1]ELP84882.1 hypothetical protein EIN_284680 [Entamoeba invadens IP1]|eukprot:XP_004184228.1 hypothetical protein EIN_284680 [Entamoeba invadens IP1]
MPCRDSLVKYIETEIIPRYKQFDKAHNLLHVRSVITESLSLSESNHLDEEMCYTIAAYHDTGIGIDRDTHHILSGQILMEDQRLRDWFTEDQLLIMKEAIEDHRASSKTPPRTIYGKVVAEADRVIDPIDTLRRTIQFTLKKNPVDDYTYHYNATLKHLHEKYARGGYLKLPFEHSRNADNLRNFQNLIEDEIALKKEFDVLYKEEVASL